MAKPHVAPEVLLKAWTSEESFTYNGKHVQIANPVTIFPKPLQRPYPPFLLMGASVDSMQLAAQLDMLPFSSAMMGMEGVRAQFGVLVHAHAALGKPLGRSGVGFLSPLLLGEGKSYQGPYRV